MRQGLGPKPSTRRTPSRSYRPTATGPAAPVIPVIRPTGPNVRWDNRWNPDTAARGNQVPSNTTYPGLPTRQTSGIYGDTDNRQVRPWSVAYETDNGILVLSDTAGQRTEDIIYLADPTTGELMLNNNGIPWTTTEYLNNWAKNNYGKATVGELRDRLAAKGWMTREQYKISSKSGNNADKVLLAAFGDAVRQVSYQNFMAESAGIKEFLNITDGVMQLPKLDTTTSGGGGGGGGRYVQINRQIFNKDDYRSVVDDAYRELTGQGADEATLDTFIKLIQKLEDKNPQKSVSIVKGKTTKTTTSGGLSAEAAKEELRKQALSSPDAENYQKATTFMNYFMNAIKETGQ